MQNLFDLKQLANDLRICSDMASTCQGCSFKSSDEPCFMLERRAAKAIEAYVEILETADNLLNKKKEEPMPTELTDDTYLR